MKPDKMSNMESLNGQFLIAMPGMGDPRFDRTVIYICDHSHKGAMGFVINRTMDQPNVPDFLMRLNIVKAQEAEAMQPQLAAAHLHSGGPVEPGRGFVLHSPEYRDKSTLTIDSAVCLTATLEILRAIATGRGPRRIIMALGYSGWAGGQLESEIAANGWLTAPGNVELLFDTNNESKYERALRQIGVNPSLLSGQAGHA